MNKAEFKLEFPSADDHCGCPSAGTCSQEGCDAGSFLDLSCIFFFSAAITNYIPGIVLSAIGEKVLGASFLGAGGLSTINPCTIGEVYCCVKRHKDKKIKCAALEVEMEKLKQFPADSRLEEKYIMDIGAYISADKKARKKLDCGQAAALYTYMQINNFIEGAGTSQTEYPLVEITTYTRDPESHLHEDI